MRDKRPKAVKSVGQDVRPQGGLCLMSRLPRSVTSFDQMVVVGRAAAQRVVQEQRDQEELERAQRRERQDRQKREREIDGYLGDVLPYLRGKFLNSPRR